MLLLLLRECLRSSSACHGPNADEHSLPYFDVLQAYVSEIFQGLPTGKGPRPVFTDMGMPFQVGQCCCCCCCCSRIGCWGGCCWRGGAAAGAVCACRVGHARPTGHAWLLHPSVAASAYPLLASHLTARSPAPHSRCCSPLLSCPWHACS